MNDEDLYNAIRKEAIDSNYYGGKPVGKDTLLYKFVAEQAKAIGVSMNGISIEVIAKEFPKSAYMGSGILTIAADNFTDTNIGSLRGVVKHELGHRHQQNRSPIKKFISLFTRDRQPKRECEADFIAGNDYINYINTTVNGTYEHSYFKPLDNSHPNNRDRYKALLTKSYIEEHTGVKLKAEDVTIGANCSFEITNPEKSKAIPSVVIDEAKKAAEAILAVTDKAASARRKDHSTIIPPVPHIHKTATTHL